MAQVSLEKRLHIVDDVRELCWGNMKISIDKLVIIAQNWKIYNKISCYSHWNIFIGKKIRESF